MVVARSFIFIMETLIIHTKSVNLIDLTRRFDRSGVPQISPEPLILCQSPLTQSADDVITYQSSADRFVSSSSRSRRPKRRS